MINVKGAFKLAEDRKKTHIEKMESEIDNVIASSFSPENPVVEICFSFTKMNEEALNTLATKYKVYGWEANVRTISSSILISLTPRTESKAS